MASFTRKSIMDAFIQLLDERPLNKISVKDIVETCGINRNTFYYHFADIPELVEEIVKEEADGIMRSSQGLSSLEECVDAAMRITNEHRQAIWHIYHFGNRDIYERYLLDICGYVVKGFIEHVIDGRPVPESDRIAIAQGYKCELFGFITDWLNRGMNEEIRQQFKRLCVLRRGMTEEMVERALSPRPDGENPAL